MATSRLTAAAAALVLLCGCEAKVGPAAGNMAETEGAAASAEGKAEEGKFTLDTPGFDLSFNIPVNTAKTDKDSRLLYPDSTVTGLFVAAGPKAPDGSDGEVELRFRSDDSPDRVAAWYRDAARAGEFRIDSSGNEGAEIRLAGTEREDGQGFKVRLAPASGGGTDGRLTVRSRD
jgi:hypothetical protein